MRLRYDAGEDRIALTLAQGEQERSYWLTRRQCVSLVRMIQERLRVLPAIEGGALGPAPTRRPTRGHGGAPADPQPKSVRIRLRELEHGLRIFLAESTGEGFGFDLDAQRLQALGSMLQELAQHAHWELDVTLARQAQAGAASVLH